MKEVKASREVLIEEVEEVEGMARHKQDHWPGLENQDGREEGDLLIFASNYQASDNQTRDKNIVTNR